MGEAIADSRPAPANARQGHAICFVIDPDFGFLQDFCKSLRSVGVDAVELLNSARLADHIDAQNPAVIFIDVNPASPYDCMRALLALKDCRFDGRVQLVGRCETAYLENFRKIGADASLTMLPVLQKPVDLATVRKIVVDQKLSSQAVPTRDMSLKTALARNFITFWYQPKIDLKRRQVVGAEAFARISHPQHGILSPGQFLAGAAEEELIALAGRALESAVKLSARLDGLGVHLKIAINISVDTLMKVPVTALVSKHRPQNDQWAGLLFEVTETQVLNKTIVLREKFTELEKYGISLSIDNFGRGNSSFSVFRNLPFSEIKIDSQFVQACANNKSSASICKSMIQTAHNFERNAVAVGIETGEDAQALMKLGCDVGQGYLFGRPMTEQQLMTMVMAGRAESANFAAPAKDASQLPA